MQNIDFDSGETTPNILSDLELRDRLHSVIWIFYILCFYKYVFFRAFYSMWVIIAKWPENTEQNSEIRSFLADSFWLKIVNVSEEKDGVTPPPRLVLPTRLVCIGTIVSATSIDPLSRRKHL